MESIKIGTKTYQLVANGYQLGERNGRVIFLPGEDSFETIENEMESAVGVQLIDGLGEVIESRKDLMYAGKLSKDTKYVVSISESGEENVSTVIMAEFREPDVRVQVSRLEETTKVVAQAAAFAATSFSDEQALQVSELYPEWSGDGVQYALGARLNYGGILYKVLQNHTSQPNWAPDKAPSLFDKILIPEPEAGPVAWEQPGSTNGYSKGDFVIHNGSTWESLVDNNVWEPGVVGTESLWKKKN